MKPLQQVAPFGIAAVLGRLGRAQAEQSLRRAARMMGRNRPESVALGDIGVPDTATALEAASLLRAKAPGVLAAHCHRTYLFGAALGTRDSLDWDAELVGRLQASRRAELPANLQPVRQEWRDRRLMALLAHKKGQPE